MLMFTWNYFAINVWITTKKLSNGKIINFSMTLEEAIRLCSEDFIEDVIDSIEDFIHSRYPVTIL